MDLFFIAIFCCLTVFIIITVWLQKRYYASKIEEVEENFSQLMADNISVLLQKTQQLQEEQTQKLVKEQQVQIQQMQQAHRLENQQLFSQLRTELGTSLKERHQEIIQTLNNNVVSIHTLIKDNQNTLLNITKEYQTTIQSVLKADAEHVQKTLKEYHESLHTQQKERYEGMKVQQQELLQRTDRRLQEMHEMVNEKLQKTLNDRIGESFKLVRDQLENVQKGLGEMQNLAQDVGGLKRVLSNVKTRGTFGEVQLGALLEQIMHPEQYEKNVITKPGSKDFVEFAIRIPSKDQNDNMLLLPIDAKFPKEIYEHLQEALEAGDNVAIKEANRIFETTIKKMAKDIHDKYIAPPHTTDFAIMFLPFESIYSEVVRRTELMEQLQRDFKIAVTGPTTLGAILNSLQLGFRTLAIQKRSSEVWATLSKVKTEFGKFGDHLSKVQKTLTTAGNQLEDVIGVRTRAIQRTLRAVGTETESLPDTTKDDSSFFIDE